MMMMMMMSKLLHCTLTPFFLNDHPSIHIRAAIEVQQTEPKYQKEFVLGTELFFWKN